MVLEALTETICNALNLHYFLGAPSADEMTAHVKAEEEFMDGGDDIATFKGEGKGEFEAFDYEAFYDHPSKPSAGDMLQAYEFIIRQSAVEPIAESQAQAAAETTTPASVPAAGTPAPAKKPPAKKAKKAKTPKRAANKATGAALKLKAGKGGHLVKPSAHAARAVRV